MQESIYRGDDVALFIDWENFKISLAAGHRLPNVSALKEEVSNHGRVVVAKAYADWVTKAPELRGASQFINDPPSLYAAGIEPVFVPTRPPSSNAAFANGVRTSRIKNSVDVKMTADCIECAHSYPNIGTFVLVSGDSDFIHVVNALRTMGKQVVVVGVSWSTSRRLADQVDTLVLYDVDVDPVVPAEPPTVVVAAAPVPALSAAPARQDLPEIIRAIEDIIRDERKAGGNPLLTSIKQRLVRRYPSFDEKKVGFPGFKKLMARVAQDGNIKLITAGLVDWAIMADEETPEGAIEESPSGVAARPSRRRGGRYSRHRQEAEAEVGTAADAPADDAQPAADDDSEYGDTEPLGAAPAVNGNAETEEPTIIDGGGNGSQPAPVSPFGGDLVLAEAMRQAVGGLDLPVTLEDGLHPERVADIIVMADYLEHQEGVSHVAFNFLVEQICENLNRGLSEDAAEITAHWGNSSSRAYVSKMLRSLSDGDFFQKGSHTWRDEASGQSRRRRTFNLNREFPLVQQVLEARWGGTEGPESPGSPESTQWDGSVSDAVEPDSDEQDSGDFEPASVEQTGFGDADIFESEADSQAADLAAAAKSAATTGETSFISRLFRPLRN